MRIVFAGTPEFAVPSLRALAATSEHDVVGVITREDAPLGRKRVLTPSPVAQAATELGIHVCKANRLGDDAAAWARELDADLGVIVAYGGLVRDPLLTLPRLGWINLHFSDLPRWRGAAPVQRALMAGEQELGVTVFRLVEALDAGDVLTRDALLFAPGTSAGNALTELAEFGTDTLIAAVRLLQENPQAGVPQRGEPSYAHKMSREDGRLDLSLPASDVLARWAGATPEPGAFVMHEQQPLKVLELRLRAESAEQRKSAEKGGDVSQQRSVLPEAIVGEARLVGGEALLVLTDGVLELARVQPAGKAAMAGADWLRGRGSSATLN